MSALLDAIELHRDVDVRSRPMRVALNRCEQAFAPPRNEKKKIIIATNYLWRNSRGGGK